MALQRVGASGMAIRSGTTESDRLWDLIRKRCSPQRSQSSQSLVIRRWNGLGQGVGGGSDGVGIGKNGGGNRLLNERSQNGRDGLSIEDVCGI